jgi:hypothetical protein
METDMKALITTTLALGAILMLSNQAAEARYYYYDAPGYVVPGPYYYGPGYGYYGYYHHRGLVPDVLGSIFGY